MAGEERVTKLKIDNVKKIYQTRKGEMTALNGVNLDIKENEFICVVGPQCGQLKPRTLIFQYFWAYILHFFTKIS